MPAAQPDALSDLIPILVALGVLIAILMWLFRVLRRSFIQQRECLDANEAVLEISRESIQVTRAAMELQRENNRLLAELTEALKRRPLG